VELAEAMMACSYVCCVGGDGFMLHAAVACSCCMLRQRCSVLRRMVTASLWALLLAEALVACGNNCILRRICIQPSALLWVCLLAEA